METQEPVAFEVFHKPLDTWFEARAYPSESGLTVSLRDVTERKERERDLERYETMVESIHDGVVTIGPDDRIRFVNEAVVRTFGVDHERLVGRSLEGPRTVKNVARIEPIPVASSRNSVG